MATIQFQKRFLMVIVLNKRTQMLCVSYENTYIIELKSHILINKNTISIIKIHNRATHLNKCKIRNKNETVLVNISNSTVKNMFENSMIPKLIQ
jgi:hypothetical protein